MEELTYMQKLIIEIARLKFGYQCSEIELVREVSRTTRMTRKQAAEDVHFLFEGGYLRPGTEATITIQTKHGLLFEGRGLVNKLDGGGASSGLGPNDDPIIEHKPEKDYRFQNLMKLFDLAEEDNEKVIK